MLLSYVSIFTVVVYQKKGNNESNQKIKMTVPVVTRVDHVYEESPRVKLEMIQSFYLPLSEPPKPSKGSGVYTEGAFDWYVYVRGFPGKATWEDYAGHADQLKRELARDGFEFAEEPIFYAVGYDGPQTQDGSRRNEVWVKAANL